MKKLMVPIGLLFFLAFVVALLLYLVTGLLLSASILGSGLLKFIEYLSVNFVISYSAMSIILLGMLFSFLKNPARVVIFNLLFVPLSLIILERYFYQQSQSLEYESVRLKITPGTVLENQKIFGYAPVKNSVSYTEEYWKDSLLWKATYTIDENGHRITPNYTPNHLDDKSILFFGCSMTFGHGLRDEGAYPYKVGQLLKDKYKIYNFAYGGYGTHQALSILEHNLLDTIVAYEPQYFVYMALPDHVNRLINIKNWGNDAPKYLLDENHEVKFQGYFHEEPLTTHEKIRNKLLESEIYKKIHGHGGDRQDVDLFIAMIDKMHDIIKKKYPSCEFHVMYWDSYWNDGSWHTPLDNLVMKRLKEKEHNGDWNIHYIKDIIPNYGEKTNFIHPKYDTHPKEFVNDTIAHYILKNIVKEGSVSFP